MSSKDRQEWDVRLQFAGRLKKLPTPFAEFKFHPKRRWRFDQAWPEHRVAVEIEGGTWRYGRHSRPAGYAADCAKYNAAALLGWRVLRYTPEMIERDPVGVAEEITQALNFFDAEAGARAKG